MSYRAPSPDEILILDRLTSTNFPGRSEVMRQLENFAVSDTGDGDNYGSKYLHTDVEAKANVVDRIPVEGHTTDSDGAEVHVLLHVVDGFVNELEIIRLDGEPMRGGVNIEKMQIFTSDQVGKKAN